MKRRTLRVHFQELVSPCVQLRPAMLPLQGYPLRVETLVRCPLKGRVVPGRRWAPSARLLEVPHVRLERVRDELVNFHLSSRPLHSVPLRSVNVRRSRLCNSLNFVILLVSPDRKHARSA